MHVKSRITIPLNSNFVPNFPLSCESGGSTCLLQNEKNKNKSTCIGLLAVQKNDDKELCISS
jgi:hypothetical protein